MHEATLILVAKIGQPRPVELNPPNAFKFLKDGERNKDKLKDVICCFKTSTNDHGLITSFTPKKLLNTKQKSLVKLLDYKKYNETITEWIRTEWFALLLKDLEIRALVIPDDGNVIIAHDFSNLEMRLLAHYSGDEKLVKAFKNDEDSHGATAVNMFSLKCKPDEVKKLHKHLRQIAKVLNFLLMYGGSANTLFDSLVKEEAVDEEGNLITKAKAKEYHELYFETYSGVQIFIQNQKKFAHKHGVVYTIAGRKRRLENINSGKFAVIAYEERLSINSPIQGSAGDCMINVQPLIEKNKRLKELGYTQFLQVHDEVVGQAPKEHAEECALLVKEIMEHPFSQPLRIPLRVDWDMGESYASAK